MASNCNNINQVILFDGGDLPLPTAAKIVWAGAFSTFEAIEMYTGMR